MQSLKASNLSLHHWGRDAIGKFFFRRWGHLTWPGDLTLGDLDLQFSGKLRSSCPNSYAKKTVALRGSVKAHYWEQKTYSLFQSNTEGSVASMRKHDMSKHRYYFLRWSKVTPSNNIWWLLWYINTNFFIGDWMLWRNSKGVATKFWLGGWSDS